MIDERVVPGTTDPTNLQKHIARYNIALMFAGGRRVLDASCGVGYGAQMLSWVADEVVGVDIDQGAIDIAIVKYNAPNIRYVRKDILEINEGIFDLVVGFETIEHIEDIDTAQHILTKHVKPGGRLVYSVPLYENYINKHHHHKFTLESGLRLFGELKTNSYMIQKGVNFVDCDKKEPFTYLMTSKIKPFY